MTTTIPLKQTALLHNNACMVTTAELLYIMSVEATTGVAFDSLLDRHAYAVSVITDAQIDSYIDLLKSRTPSQCRPAEVSTLSRLAVTLRVMRDRAGQTVTVH